MLEKNEEQNQGIKKSVKQKILLIAIIVNREQNSLTWSRKRLIMSERKLRSRDHFRERVVMIICRDIRDGKGASRSPRCSPWSHVLDWHSVRSLVLSVKIRLRLNTSKKSKLSNTQKLLSNFRNLVLLSYPQGEIYAQKSTVKLTNPTQFTKACLGKFIFEQV